MQGLFFGFGLFAVELKAHGALVGMCGLIKRDTLEDVDIGFAFLPDFEGQGLAHEAASATLEARHCVVPLREMCPHAELVLGRVRIRGGVRGGRGCP